ncbi:hypothetical protein FGO68_gene210 [Halteria grandinella]|uniref:NAD-dependent epimerase/dehydratase domain-containing protein n=1 Tax=Halteria grandinella TaxID=5974 RepID=A0A8J8T0A2_HALGN|nr:hypothetical protein FGO68_gene210 [Halteria grandinella]
MEFHPQTTKPIVVITGVTGYLGSHCAEQFLKDGTYAVRGTVRDKNNEEKIAPLRNALGAELFSKLTLVNADLLDPASIDHAIAGADYVVHTASPNPMKQPKDENVLIKPAVEGTLAVMRAAQKHKVKRVVQTSSLLAIFSPAPSNRKETYSDKDWSDPETKNAYGKSKTLTERAAWEFMEKLPLKDKFEFVVINPGAIMGPTYVNNGFASGEFMSDLLSGKFPRMPKVMIPLVNVRDVAKAHLLALKSRRPPVRDSPCVRKQCGSARLHTQLTRDCQDTILARASFAIVQSKQHHGSTIPLS